MLLAQMTNADDCYLEFSFCHHLHILGLPQHLPVPTELALHRISHETDQYLYFCGKSLLSFQLVKDPILVQNLYLSKYLLKGQKGLTAEVKILISFMRN